MILFVARLSLNFQGYCGCVTIVMYYLTTFHSIIKNLIYLLGILL